MNNPTRQSVLSFGISLDESRKKRETQTISLRKKAREEMLSKRRQIISSNEPQMNINFDKEIQENIALLHSEDINEVITAARAFRQMLSFEQDPPIDQIINAGIVQRLLTCLYSPNEELQYESLWCLTNIASGTHEHTKYIVELDVMDIFLKFLGSNNHKIREQAAWVIGNIAGDCSDFRDYALETGCMNSILHLLHHEEKINVIKVATWTMSNLCRGKPDYSLVKDAVAFAASQVYTDDKDILIDVLWTLTFLSDGEDEKQAEVSQYGIEDQLIHFLEFDELKILVPSLRIVGNLLSGDNHVTQKVIEAGVLDSLKRLLTHEKDGIRKEACWSLSNVLAGTEEQIDQVIKQEIIPIILYMLERDRFDIRKEAAWCIANAVSGANSKQILYFTYHGCLPMLCNLLNINDMHLIDMALDAIEKCLKLGKKLHADKSTDINIFVKTIIENGGHDILHKFLLRNNNKELYEKCRRIIDNYLTFNTNEIEANVDTQRGSYSFNVQDPDEPYGI